METTLQGINVTDAWNLCKNNIYHPDQIAKLTILEFANHLHQRAAVAVSGAAAVAVSGAARPFQLA